eukprot:c18882_g2_i2.p1 GENE.c18882_g2_i2~~c18882_g2_i2.p1  ORF type:complete len:367 (+),score=151.56 c18882_g2_i2:2-1102(+)
MSSSQDTFLGQCRSINRFQITDKIGEGTYGTVYKAKDLDSEEIVALKRVKMEKVSDSEGFPMTMLREIQILTRIKHPNIVNLKEVVVGSTRNRIFLVFEYCEHDLARMLDFMKYHFTESEVKCLLYQLLEAIHHLHSNFIIHRDIKLSNLLFTNTGSLKLADFGLARTFSPYPQAYTPNVVTLWYRAPELLLGDAKYTTSLDMWSVGCIFAELYLHSPLLPGKTEIQQIDLICRLLGTPSEKIWPGFCKLPAIRNIKLGSYPYSNLKAILPNLGDHGFDLLQRLLVYDPTKRLRAKDALSHPYFTTNPLPKAQHLMPTFPPFNLTPVKSERSDRNSPSQQRESSSSQPIKKLRTESGSISKSSFGG